MVRTYNRTTAQHSWEEQNMSAAIIAVREGKMGYQRAADSFGVPMVTLYRRVKKEGDAQVVSKKKLGRFRNVFTEEEENELVEHCLFMEKRLFGLKPLELRRLAFDYASKNNIEHCFKDGMAGKDWYQGFIKRHPQLTLRVPEQTSAARAGAFNKENVAKFFSLLQNLQHQHNFRPSRIFNVDETGISTVPNKSSKIIGLKGKKRVGILSSAERGTTTTAVICCNAGGQFIPPLIIFPRARENPDLLNGTPPETVMVCHPSGWMQSEIFCPIWFTHFLKCVKPTEDDPVLLILDGHATHTKNINLLEQARQNHVSIICIPPHTSHRLQPLDVTFMLPLSTYYAQESETWLRQNPGKVVTIRQVGLLFGKAYRRAATPRNAENGFKNTGISPLDPQIFADEEFAAAETTDRPQIPENDINFQNEAGPSGLTVASPTTRPMSAEVVHCSSDETHQEEAGPSRCNSTTPCRPTSNKVVANINHVSPSDIMPLPKSQGTPKRRNNNRGKTAILTSSPYMNELKDKAAQGKKADTVKPKRKLFEKNQVSTDKRRMVTKSKMTNDEENAECLFCKETYLASKPGENWVLCSVCKNWAHEICSSFDPDTHDVYICDFCL